MTIAAIWRNEVSSSVSAKVCAVDQASWQTPESVHTPIVPAIRVQRLRSEVAGALPIMPMDLTSRIACADMERVADADWHPEP
jgi:hypothetical protein